MDAYEFDGGNLAISELTDVRSSGALTLYAGGSTDRYTRHVSEQLLQVSGSVTLRLFYDEGPEDVTLEEGDHYVVPAGLEHQFSNDSDDASVTLWRYDGDVLDVMDRLTDEYEPM